MQGWNARFRMKSVLQNNTRNWSDSQVWFNFAYFSSVSETDDLVTGWMIRVQFSRGASPLPRRHSCVDVSSGAQGLKAEGKCEAEILPPLRAETCTGLPLRNYVPHEFAWYSTCGAPTQTGLMPEIRVEQNTNPALSNQATRAYCCSNIAQTTQSFLRFWLLLATRHSPFWSPNPFKRQGMNTRSDLWKFWREIQGGTVVANNLAFSFCNLFNLFWKTKIRLMRLSSQSVSLYLSIPHILFSFSMRSV